MRTRMIPRILFSLFLLLVAAAVVYLYLNSRKVDTQLKASGTVEVVSVVVSPEMAGRVMEIRAAAGDQVEAGDVLFSLDPQLLEASRRQAQAALESALAGAHTAEAGVESARAAEGVAQAGVETAVLRYEAELAAARLEERSSRQAAWLAGQPAGFDRPAWYYSKSEQLVAAGAAMTEADAALQEANNQLKIAVASLAGGKVLQLEADIAQAREQVRAAELVLARARLSGDEPLVDAADEQYDAALDHLNALQDEYDDLLSNAEAGDLLDARARAASAREVFATSADRLASLQTGPDSLKVKIALSAVGQAKASLLQAGQAVIQAQAAADQARTSLAQAEAQLALVEVQLKKLVVSAPAAGLVLTRSIETGEVIQPGTAAMTLGMVQEPTITVFVNEDRYGMITLGEHAAVSVDSFPGETFDAVVIQIADQAEFTPRNVQTEAGRSTTVFAIKLSLADTSGRLKPGMPATVRFGE